MAHSLRLLLDPPLTGPVNMARDEALLAAVGEAVAPPTLRLYAWSPPTVSLGYFQPVAEFEALPPPAGRLALVRRTTGGGAILHDRELTYSLVLPIAHAWLSAGTTALYERVHRAVIRAVGGGARMFGREPAGGAVAGDAPAGCDHSPRAPAACGENRAQGGPFFCFARRHAMDVVVDAPAGATRKLAGSAQRRARSAVLQHGSLMLDSRFDQQPCATWIELDGPRGFEDAARRFVDAVAVESECRLTPGTWSDDELARAERLVEKYSAAEWTRAR